MISYHMNTIIGNQIQCDMYSNMSLYLGKNYEQERGVNEGLKLIP